jgi:hypothetical protein
MTVVDVTGFNRRRRELATQQAAKEAAKAKTQPELEAKSLDEMTYQELRALAKEKGIEGYYQMNTEELREALREGE